MASVRSRTFGLLLVLIFSALAVTLASSRADAQDEDWTFEENLPDLVEEGDDDSAPDDFGDVDSGQPPPTVAATDESGSSDPGRALDVWTMAEGESMAGRAAPDPALTEYVDLENEDRPSLGQSERPAPVPTGVPSVNDQDAASWPDSSRTRNEAVWNLGDGEPHVLIGYNDTDRFSVGLPAGWRVVGDAVLETSLAASEIARADASLRLDVAGRPATTWTLAETSQLQLPLDSSLFESDAFESHDFDIVASTTATLVVEPECIDRDHVGRWVDLGHPTVRATVVPSELDVARAIRSYGVMSELLAQPITVVIPDAASAQVLETLGSVVAAIGQHGTPVGWSLVKNTPGTLLPSADLLIVINEQSGLEAEAGLVIDGDRPILQLAGEGSGLVELADAMADPGRLLFFHQPRMQLRSVPLASPSSARDVVTFDDAGYDDRTLTGGGTQGLLFRVHIPAGAKPSSVSLALFGAYSPAIGEAGVAVSVSVNGGDNELVALTDAEGRLDVIHPLGDDDLRPGLNFVRVEVAMGSETTSGCDGEATVDADRWFTVFESSGVGVARDTDEMRGFAVDVAGARFALAAQQDFDATDVVVRADPPLVDVVVAAQLIADIASRSSGGSPRLVTDDDVDTSRHLVVVGEAASRPLLDGLPYAENGAPVGVIVAQQSPFDDHRLFLAFTGGTSSDASRSARIGMSAAVNEISSSMALAGRDEVIAVGESSVPVFGDLGTGGAPDDLAFVDGAERGPSSAQYEDWLAAQNERVQAAESGTTTTRRAIALGLLLLAATVGALLWIRKLRNNDDTASAAGGH